MSTQNETFTYMRNALPKAVRATCPLCCRAIKVAADGRMVRHGWKETGRKVGQQGLGFQWGECPATGSRPLEQTDADAIEHLEQLKAAAEDWERKAEEHKAGRDYYDRKVEVQVGAQWRDIVADAFKESGLEVIKVETERKSKHGSYVREYEVTTYRIPRGTEKGAYVSYEKTRKVAQSYAESCARQLRGAQADLERAIEYHRTHEPSRKAEPNRGPAVHARGYRFGTLCASRGMSPRVSDKPEEVTCARCKKRLAERAEREARKAAQG